MPSECFVINEWLIHDLLGDNGEEAREESYKLLVKLKEKCDRIAVLNGSPWMNKAYMLMKCGEAPTRFLSKYLHGVILRDPKKCEMLNKSEIKDLPENVKNLVPQDDLYLFEIYYSTSAKLLVTSDQRLLQVFSNASDINMVIKLRDEFLREYLR